MASDIASKLNIAMFGQKRFSREGGIEVVVVELSTRMAAMGHHVTCFNRSGHHVSGAEFEIVKGDEYKGVRLRVVPTIEKRGLAAVTSSFFSSLRAGIGRYDIIHIHAEGSAAFSWIPKLFGKRVIVTVHGLDWKRAKWKGSIGSKYIHFAERCAAKRADEIIVLSERMQEYFQKEYGRETRFIPNGVDRPQIIKVDLIKKYFDLDKDTYILFLGRIVPEKGGHYLVEAFKNIKTDKKLVISGGVSDSDGYMEKLKEMTKEDDRIIFTGFIQGQVLAELYSNAYIYVLPSDLEGMPLSLLEAMSYGNCCICSDIPECAEVVEDKAVTFKRSDVMDLADKLQTLIDEPEQVKKYKIGSADFICKKYNWEKVTKKTLEAYRGVVE